MALAVTGGLLALAHVAFGYGHYAALARSMKIQQGLAEAWARPYFYTVFWDVYDFFLASGWLSFGLLAAFLTGWKHAASKSSYRVPAFAAAGALTLLIVDLSGLLAGETARVWLFLQPLIIPVAAMELSRWSKIRQTAALGTMLFVLAVIRARMHLG